MYTFRKFECAGSVFVVFATLCNSRRIRFDLLAHFLYCAPACTHLFQ
jgi:hypothetical protein